MLENRVIPSLLIKNGGLVKTKKFKDPKYVGDPINAIRIFNDKEVDELVLLDIDATRELRGPNYDLLKDIASECFMPMAYGGGVSTISHISTLLRIGFEKVILNTSLFKSPNFVSEAVSKFGSQAIVASIDVKNKILGKQEVFIESGNRSTGMDPIRAAQFAEKLGVGEILLTSIDKEGLMDGYDIDLIKKVSTSVNIPVIASGGAGKLHDFLYAIRDGKASAVSAGSMFVYYGPHRAVLITYPQYTSLIEIFKEDNL